MCNKRQIRDFDSFYELVSYFDTEEKCQEHLATLRWNGEPECPYCLSKKVNTLKGKTKRYKCYGCRKQFGIRVGTIFHDSKLSLRKWFFAIFLFSAHKKGVSSHQLSRDLKITQKTAWFVLHRIREIYKAEQPTFERPVEVDETYIGGKEKNKHKNKKTPNSQGRSTKSKTPVIGIIERGGKVYALPVKKTDSETVAAFVNTTTATGVTVYTDEWHAYNALNKSYNRQVVKHNAGEYVRGEVHTNSIENFWSHFKRGIYGIYHQVSDKHLASYVNEFTFRFNSRTTTDGSRFDITLANSQKRLTYNDLIKRSN